MGLLATDANVAQFESRRKQHEAAAERERRAAACSDSEGACSVLFVECFGHRLPRARRRPQLRRFYVFCLEQERYFWSP